MSLSLDESLARTMTDDSFVQAMLEGVSRFERYRSAIPLVLGAYARMLLRKTPAFELVAMQWAPSCSTPIHDHGHSRCWIVMLDGELHVENFARLDDGTEQIARLNKTSQTRFAAGQVDARKDWRELHRVANLGPASAFSLQLYAAPQIDYMVVDERTGRCTRALPSYDAIFEL